MTEPLQRLNPFPDESPDLYAATAGLQRLNPFPEEEEEEETSFSRESSETSVPPLITPLSESAANLYMKTTIDSLPSPQADSRSANIKSELETTGASTLPNLDRVPGVRYMKSGHEVYNSFRVDPDGHVPTHRIAQIESRLAPGETIEQLEERVLGMRFNAEAKSPIRTIDALQPQAAVAAADLLKKAREAGRSLVVNETLRTQGRQDYLFQQGRSRNGRIVTWTLTSDHSDGNAIDFDGSKEDLRWLHANAGRFGFEPLQGELAAIDPGHVRYVARDKAAAKKRAEMAAAAETAARQNAAMAGKLAQPKAPTLSGDYDYESARAAGLGPDETGHWPSRVPSGPLEGLILKSAKHPTFAKTVAGEKAAGFAIVARDGRLWSVPMDRLAAETGGAPSILRPGLTGVAGLIPAVRDSEIVRDLDKALMRGASGIVGAVGGVLEREGREFAEKPQVEVPLLPVPGMPTAKIPLPGIAGKLGEAVAKAGEGLEAVQTTVQEVHPRPDYAQTFWQGMKTDPAKTMAVSAAENLPNMVAVIAASAVNPALGLGTAYALEAGNAYQEAKESGATEEQARDISGWVGLGNMALEYLPAGRLLRQLPGGTIAAKRALMTEMLKQGASEGVTESLQEANQVISQALTTEKWPSFRDFAKRVGESLVTGTFLGVFGGGAGAAVQPQVEQAASQPVEEVEAPPVEAMAHAGSDVSPEAISRVARGERYVRISPGGEVTPILNDVAAVDVQVNPGEVKAVVGADGIPRVETGRPNAAQARALETLGAEPPPIAPRQVQEQPESIVEELPPAAEEDLLASLGVRRGAAAPIAQINPFPEEVPRETPDITTASTASLRSEQRAIAASDDWSQTTGDRYQEIARELKRRSGEEEVPRETSEAQEAEAPEAAPVLKPPSPPRAPIVTGARDVAVTERGDRIEFDYAVMDARDLIASNDDTLRPNPAYPQEIQPRDRARATSEAQVSRIQKTLNPELLAASPRVSDGAPIIGEDRIVESGNARTIGIRRAYKDAGPPAESYAAWVRARTAQFGIDPEAVAGIEQPVLVRVRRTPVDRAEFARRANEGTLASMGATERAMADAERLTPEMLEGLRFPDIGDINWNQNREFVQAFGQRVVSPNEQGMMYDERGQLSVEGQNRLRNAVLAKAYGDPDAVARLIESADSNVRNVGTGMLRAAPRLVRLQADIARGALHPLDIAEDVTAAVRKLSTLREEGTKVETYLAQQVMFGSDLSAEARELLAAFDAHGRSGRQVADILRRYVELAEGAGDPRQTNLLGRAEAPSKLGLIQEAVRTREQAGQGELFEGRALPSRIVSSQGEAGALAVPTPPTSGPVKRWLRRHFTSAGSLPQALFETKVARDGRVAARLNRIDALARDLAHQMRRYRGPLTREQLARYLDDAYRGMNLRTGGEALDEVQIQRIARQRGIAPKVVREQVARTIPESEADLREAPQFIPIIREMRQHTDALTRSLRRAGLLDDAVARELERSFGLYVHRQYEAVRNERWAERIKKQPLWNRAFELTKAKFPDKPDSQIWGMLEAYIDRAGGPGRAILPGGTPEGAKDLSILRERTGQDDFRRLLLGEVREAGSNFFTTAAKMATLLEQQKFLDDFSAVGQRLGVLTARPDVLPTGEATKTQIDPGMYAKAIEKATGAQPEIGEPPGLDRLVVKRSHGRTKATESTPKADPLGGLYTTDEINQELQRLFEHESFPAWLRYYMTANYGVKAFKTVGSIQATARNFLSNFLYVTMQGANPLNPQRFAEAGKVSYPRVFGNTNREMMDRVEEYQRLGLFDQGTDLGDLKRQEREAQLFRGQMVGAGRTGARIVRGFQEFYQAPDNFSKAYVFESLLPAYRKAYPNLSEAEVRAKLASVLRDTMQNYSQVPRGIQMLSGRFPLIAPFLSFTEEIVRNTKNTAIIGIREVKEGRETGNKALENLGRRKLLGLAVAYSIPSVTAAIGHWLFNTDDEEEEAARHFLPPWTKNGTIIVQNKGNGEIVAMDLSFMDTFAQIKDPVLAALRGDLDGAMEELLTPVGEEILAGALADIFYQNEKPGGGEVYNPEDFWLPRQLDKARYLWKVGGPGTLLTAQKIYDALRSEELPEGQRRVLWQEVVAVAGPRIATYDLGRSVTFKAYGYKRRIRKARELETAPAKKGKRSAADLVRPEEKAIIRIKEILLEMDSDIEAARTLGLDDEKIKAALREGGVGKREAQQLLDGDHRGILEHLLELNQEQVDEAQAAYAN